MDFNEKLEFLETNLVSQKYELEKQVSLIDDQKKQREADRKKILIIELKKVMTVLNDADEEVSQNLKKEALDVIDNISQIEDEISAVFASLSTDSISKEVINESVINIRAKISKIEENFPSTALTLSVAENPVQMLSFSDSMSRSVYIGTPQHDPSHFTLDCSLISPTPSEHSFLHAQIHFNLPNNKFNTPLLSKLVFSMHELDAASCQQKKGSR